jgi:hypothetical protein
LVGFHSRAAGTALTRILTKTLLNFSNASALSARGRFAPHIVMKNPHQFGHDPSRGRRPTSASGVVGINLAADVTNIAVIANLIFTQAVEDFLRRFERG